MSFPSNYYDFFEIGHQLNLDPVDLEKRFYALSRRWHPDLFSRRSAAEKQESLEATAVLNDAYRTLRDPITRAEYLLREQGFDTVERKSSEVPPELLEEVFELNMALEELKGGDSDAIPQLEHARAKFTSMRDEIDGSLQQRFAEYDKNPEHAVLEQIRALLNRRKYIRNLVGEVEKVLVANVSN